MLKGGLERRAPGGAHVGRRGTSQSLRWVLRRTGRCVRRRLLWTETTPTDNEEDNGWEDYADDYDDGDDDWNEGSVQQGTSLLLVAPRPV